MANTPAQRFGAYIREAARASGYDIDSRRGGDRTRLADAAGMSLTTMSRMLSGERLPDARSFAALGKALRVPLTDLLVQGGIVPEPEPGPTRFVDGPDQVADAWGIEDEVGRAIVREMFERLKRRHEPMDPKEADDNAV